ncbi:unnamed protein product [Calypogeia fissa]
MIKQNLEASSPPRSPAAVAPALTFFARVPGYHLLAPRPPVNSNQERIGSKLSSRSERNRLSYRRGSVGHPGLIQSTTFRRFRKGSVTSRWRSGSLNSLANSEEGTSKESRIRRSAVHQEGRRRERNESSGTKNSAMIMDVVEASSTSVLSSPQHARWGGALLVSIKALAILLLTVVLVQLRFSSLVARIVLVLSRSFSFLLHKPSSPIKSQKSEVEKVHQQTIESLEEEGIKIPSLDYESARRETRALYQNRIYQILGIYPDEDVENLEITEKCEKNSRNIDIFSKRWIPRSGEIKAAICFCHGYGDTCTFFFEGIARKLASQNFAVFAMDYPGFGLSGGLHGYIESFDSLVDCVTEHYASLKKQDVFKGIPFFLMGESMGGAVALKAHFSMPTTWDGAVLIAPMCKISEEMYPPWFLLEILKVLARIVPKARIVPSGDIAEIGFQDVVKRRKAMQNIIAYVGKPRLGTALSLIKATDDIEKLLDKVSLPMLILHGAKDRVTDPAVSKALYEQSCSHDKTLNVYENAWHAVLEGESDEAIDRAIGDIVAWLDARSAKRST